MALLETTPFTEVKQIQAVEKLFKRSDVSTVIEHALFAFSEMLKINAQTHESADTKQDMSFAANQVSVLSHFWAGRGASHQFRLPTQGESDFTCMISAANLVDPKTRALTAIPNNAHFDSVGVVVVPNFVSASTRDDMPARTALLMRALSTHTNDKVGTRLNSTKMTGMIMRFDAQGAFDIFYLPSYKDKPVSGLLNVYHFLGSMGRSNETEQLRPLVVATNAQLQAFKLGA